jgi:ABC-2 type transport system permease protein
MREDILNVMWKESKGLLRYSSSRWKAVVILLTPIALFGILIPIQFRDEWLTTGWSVAVAIITPLMLITTTIAESFAGERERHTLETLLASRLPDRAVLLGKLFVSILFGWGMTLLLLFVSMLVVNMLDWDGRFRIYQPIILGSNLLTSLLMSGLVANLGILISLRSATVQSAAQTIMLMLFMPLMLLQAVVFLIPSFLPKDTVRAFLDRLNFTNILLAVLAILLVANIALFLGALGRFKRSKLILS